MNGVLVNGVKIEQVELSSQSFVHARHTNTHSLLFQSVFSPFHTHTHTHTHTRTHLNPSLLLLQAEIKYGDTIHFGGAPPKTSVGKLVPNPKSDIVYELVAAPETPSVSRVPSVGPATVAGSVSNASGRSSGGGGDGGGGGGEGSGGGDDEAHGSAVATPALVRRAGSVGLTPSEQSDSTSQQQKLGSPGEPSGVGRRWKKGYLLAFPNHFLTVSSCVFFFLSLFL